jgi:hypothetical protein
VVVSVNTSKILDHEVLSIDCAICKSAQRYWITYNLIFIEGKLNQNPIFVQQNGQNQLKLWKLKQQN